MQYGCLQCWKHSTITVASLVSLLPNCNLIYFSLPWLKQITGEMLVGRARCFFMDDVSTGLDSSTTLEIMTFLRQMAHLMDLTMVISLLQPAPETFELFDDIILLCEGQIVYHGPRQNVIGFFNTIGFTCPSRKNIADFLQEASQHKLEQININKSTFLITSFLNFFLVCVCASWIYWVILILIPPFPEPKLMFLYLLCIYSRY